MVDATGPVEFIEPETGDEIPLMEAWSWLECSSWA